MAIVGMDVEQVQTLGQNLKHQADAIGQVIAAVNGLVQHSQEIWKGNDSQQFHGWWEQQHRPALQHVMEAVAGLGQSALNNASDQHSASSH